LFSTLYKEKLLDRHAVLRRTQEIKLILKIRNVKQTCGGIVSHYRKYYFLNPDGTTVWEKWDRFEESLYEVVSA